MTTAQKARERRATASVLALALTIALVGTLRLAPVFAQSLEVELQRAIQTETVTGDLNAAIDAYAKIAARAGSNRAVAAQALLRLAQAHQKLGDAESRKIYERIIREFADQQAVVAEAKSKLAAFGTASAVATGRAARQLWLSDSIDGLGSVSGDGRFVSMTDWVTGDLTVRDIATATTRRLTNTGGWETSGDFAEFSLVSPDGQQVAYAWYTDKAKANFYDLRLLRIADVPAKPRILHRSTDTNWIRPCAWTPDGRSLIVVRALMDGTNQIEIVSLSDGSLRLIKKLDRRDPIGVALSPDGRFIAYDFPTRGDSAGRDIFVVPINAGPEVTVVPGPTTNFRPFWSPDGSRLLFLSDRSGTEALWSVAVADGKPTSRAELVTPQIGRAVLGVTRNGAVYYAKIGGGNDVYVADIDADVNVKGTPALLTERFIGANSSPAWSPDGLSVAYYSSRGTRESVGSTALVIHSLKSKEERDIPLRFVASIPQQTAVQWFPDGRSLLVVAGEPERQGKAYYRVDATTGQLELLRRINGRAISNNQPQLSPDGKTIFHTDGSPQNRLVRFDIETGVETILKTGFIGALAISPDGSQLAYVGYIEGDDSWRGSQLGVIPTAGGPGRVLFKAKNWGGADRFNAIGWSRDQRYVLFVREEPKGRTLWRVAVDGGTSESTGLVFNGRIKSPRVHPNGRQLAFSTVNRGPGELWVLENFLPRTATRD